MGGKVNEPASKLLRGQQEGKDYPTRMALPGAAAKGKESGTGYRRLGARQAGARKYEWPPGKTHDTDRTGAPRGSRTADRPGKRLLPRGTKPPSRPIPPLWPEAMTRRPDRLGSSPADRLTAAVTTAPGPTQRRTTPSLLTTPPALPSQGCPRSPLTVPAQAAAGKAAQEASARAPSCRWVWPRPLPAPRRLAHLFLRLLLLLPQPPPPQPPEASLPLQQAHLFRIAPRPGAEGPPLGGNGGASGGRPRPLRASLRVRSGRLPAGLHA